MSAAPVPASQIYEAACILGMKGYKLIRVGARSKVPVDRNWPEIATNAVAVIDEWFQKGSYNIGLACGMQPNGRNIVAIDIDPKNGGRETWQALTNEYGAIGGPRHKTPHGGFHLPLVFPEGFRNSRNLLGPGIDTRGEGGQIVLPPSEIIDVETGEILAYGCPPGRGLFDMDPIEAPEWLIERLSAPLPEIRQSQQRHPSTHGSTWNNDETPFDYLRRTANPVDVMVDRYGWQVHSVRGDDTYLTRPGKSVRNGHSAVVHANGAIVVFTTTDVDHLIQRPTSDGTGIKMSLAEFIAAEETGGDLSALSSKIRRELMPSSPAAGWRPAEDEGEPDGSDERDDDDGGWATPVDLDEVLAGTLVVPQPTILARTDGMALFYPGMINGIHGDSGLGKGWVALVAVVEQIKAHRTVAYIDLEDTVGSVISRLRTLGLEDDEIKRHFIYLHPHDESSHRGVDSLVNLVVGRECSLVILDSLGEAFGLDTVNEDKDNEVGPWLRQLPRKLAEAGPAVVVVDHVTKAGDNPLHPSGSKRKRAAIGGASYLVEATRSLAQGRGGTLKLTCAKDRHGNHIRGQVTAEIWFTSRGDQMSSTVRAPGIEIEVSAQEKYDAKMLDTASNMQRVARRRTKPFIKEDILSATDGASREIKRAAFEHLLRNGHFVLVGKKGRAELFFTEAI